MVRNTKSAHTIYDHARGAGWILAASARIREADEDSLAAHKIDLVLYYTGDMNVETHGIKLGPHSNGVDGFLRGYLDIGTALGAYEGTHVKPNRVYGKQQKAVRRQRHAPDIFAALSSATGFSPTMAVRAAEAWGSQWTDKTSADDWTELRGIGEQRGHEIERAIGRADL